MSANYDQIVHRILDHAEPVSYQEFEKVGDNRASVTVLGLTPENYMERQNFTHEGERWIITKCYGYRATDDARLLLRTTGMSAQTQIVYHLGALSWEALHLNPKISWHLQGIKRAWQQITKKQP